MEKKFTCIVCPVGCELTATLSEDGKSVVKVTGNSCKRGEKYAVEELTASTRTLTSTVRLKGAADKLLPVRTDRPIPKNSLSDAMKIINLITPAYYEVALKTKYSRDNESEAMFDIIFNSIKWDIGFMYDWGGIKSALRALVTSKNADLASRYEKLVNQITKSMDKAVEAYSELE